MKKRSPTDSEDSKQVPHARRRKLHSLGIYSLISSDIPLLLSGTFPPALRYVCACRGCGEEVLLDREPIDPPTCPRHGVKMFLALDIEDVSLHDCAEGGGG